MHYEGIVYRPPSEANSIIVQVTLGCRHNKCTFCTMYKDKQFKIRDLQKIYRDLEEERQYYSRVDRIFLADGNALSVSFDMLQDVLLKIKEIYPECSRVGIYASAKDILNKTDEELLKLKTLGLGIIYMGLESGSDKILHEINKGITKEEMILAGKKVKNSGIKLSVTVISGLGGKDNWKEHAIETGKVVSLIDPDYLGVLTLILSDKSKLSESIKEGKFKLLTPEEVMLETTVMLQNIETTNCIFRSNHASNYVSLKGTLPFDKEKLINIIKKLLKEGYNYKEEIFRAL